jgi:hypothetical protein
MSCSLTFSVAFLSKYSFRLITINVEMALIKSIKNSNIQKRCFCTLSGIGQLRDTKPYLSHLIISRNDVL